MNRVQVIFGIKVLLVTQEEYNDAYTEWNKLVRKNPTYRFGQHLVNKINPKEGFSELFYSKVRDITGFLIILKDMDELENWCSNNKGENSENE